MLDISFIPAFKDNYIWLLRKGQRAVVVDPGDATPVKARLAAEGLKLEAILVTHHHADHQGGVTELVGAGNIPVYGPADESITGCTVSLCDGDRFEVLGEPVEVMDVRGHTAGHIAYRFAGCVFCGDTLFGAGCGRVFEGSMEEMFVAISRLAALPDDTRLYCAHEYTEANLRFALAVEPDNPDVRVRAEMVAAQRRAGRATVPLSLREERLTNPFLRCEVPRVQAMAQQRHPGAIQPVAVFAALRSWKNDF